MLPSMQLTRTVLGSSVEKDLHPGAKLKCHGGCTNQPDTHIDPEGTDWQCRRNSPARTVHWMELPVQGCGIRTCANISLFSLQKSPFHMGTDVNGAPIP